MKEGGENEKERGNKRRILRSLEISELNKMIFGRVDILGEAEVAAHHQDKTRTRLSFKTRHGNIHGNDCLKILRTNCIRGLAKQKLLLELLNGRQMWLNCQGCGALFRK